MMTTDDRRLIEQAREPWQTYRCNYRSDGLCVARIAAACICNSLAYRKALAALQPGDIEEDGDGGG